MKQSVLLLALAIGASACAYDNPTSADPPPLDEKAPATISIGAIVGTGSDAGHATIAAKVQNFRGNALSGVLVTFVTTAGTLMATSVGTDEKGVASTTMTATPTEPAKITAVAGHITAQMTIVMQAPPPPPPDPGPPPSPDPGPPGPGPLTVQLLVTPGNTGTETTFGIASPGITRAAWTFGDGASSTTTAPNTTHVYAKAGTYTATVTITDSMGRTASDSETFAISDPTLLQPSYSVTLTAVPTTILVGELTTLTANVSPQNGAPSPTTFTWTFGDGSASVMTSTKSTTYVYTKDGTFTATVTATGGSVSGVGQTTVTAKTPVVGVSCSTGVRVGSPSQCVASATVNGSVIPSVLIKAVVWDFGDGSTASTPGNQSPGHVYAAAATYTVVAIATVIIATSTGATSTGTGNTTTTILPLP